MSSRDSYDIVDGQKVPQTFVTKDYELVGTHQGTINVESGEFTLLGTLQGTLNINTTDQAQIIGKQQGTVYIAQGGYVTVTGAIEGTTTVEFGATLVIEATGKLAGTLTCDGTVIIRGVFGGSRSGRGDFRLDGNGYIKQPVTKNGISYYEW